jgi:hypothetical protein
MQTMRSPNYPSTRREPPTFNNQKDHRQLYTELGQRLGQWPTLKTKTKKDLAPFDAKSLIYMIVRNRSKEALEP